MEKVIDKNKKAKDIASKIINWCADVASDAAYSMADGFMDDKWKRKINQAKKRGVRDIQGWLADEIYNDKDIMHDLIGDRVWDECGKDIELRNLVIGEISNCGGVFTVVAKELRRI
jgi:hypothetical protein